MHKLEEHTNTPSLEAHWLPSQSPIASSVGWRRLAQVLGAYAVWASVLKDSAAHIGGFEPHNLNNLCQISTVSRLSDVNIVILSKLKSTIISSICYAR